MLFLLTSAARRQAVDTEQRLSESARVSGEERPGDVFCLVSNVGAGADVTVHKDGDDVIIGAAPFPQRAMLAELSARRGCVVS